MSMQGSRKTFWRQPCTAAAPQEDLAGALREQEGDVPAAVALYLRGSAPGRAAQV